MKIRIAQWLMVLFALLSCTPNDEREDSTSPCSTGDALSITENSCIFEGYANLTPDLGEVSMGFLYSLDSNPSADNSIELTTRVLDSNNKFYVSVTSLSSGTVYYYRAFIQYGGIVRLGKTKSFKTAEITASVSTKSAVLNQTKATLSGELIVNSLSSLNAEVFFYYSNTESSREGLLLRGTKINAVKADNGSYLAEISGLQSGNKYYYVACAKVYDREFYGEVLSFNTATINAKISLNAVKDITPFTALVSGSVSVESPDGSLISVDVFYSSSESSLNGLVQTGMKKTATIESGSFQITIGELAYNTKYNYCVRATIHDKEFYSSIYSFSTIDYAVNLGLSVKWAWCNMNAVAPEQTGYYYAWGETSSKSTFTAETYKWYKDGDMYKITKYNTLSMWGEVDNKTELEPADDVAYTTYGYGWRIPKPKEIEELISSPFCYWTWTTRNEVQGYEVYSSKTGNSIFLPKVSVRLSPYVTVYSDRGFYWSSSYGDNPNIPYVLEFSESNIALATSALRLYGIVIRPVYTR